MIVVSVGCPSGVGPEVSVAAAARIRGAPRVLVGDEATIREAAEFVGVARSRLTQFEPSRPVSNRIYVHQVGSELTRAERRPGKPSRIAGARQLQWIDAAFALTKAGKGRALVTGPVSKWAIAGSGAPGAKAFRGHTEWLRDRDGARDAVMCFASKKLTTSLVTTHLPVARVPRHLSPARIEAAVLALAELLRARGLRRPRIVVASLNPHAGEAELLGAEESRAIAPGTRSAAKRLGRRAIVMGPMGAETAYRRAVAGDFDGVVAMYHDQATIPMKLVAFGDAVNVTMGLSVIRTSVDHGTAYDIAWRGVADAKPMIHAMRLAQELLNAAPRRPRVTSK